VAAYVDGPTDAVLLESLDQGRLRVARRRLGEVLLGIHGLHGRHVPFLERRQAALLLIFGVVLTFGVDARETVEGRASGSRPEVVAVGREFGRCRLLRLGGHLAGQGALPDQPVQRASSLLRNFAAASGSRQNEVGRIAS